VGRLVVEGLQAAVLHREQEGLLGLALVLLQLRVLVVDARIVERHHHLPRGDLGPIGDEGQDAAPGMEHGHRAAFARDDLAGMGMLVGLGQVRHVGRDQTRPRAQTRHQPQPARAAGRHRGRRTRAIML